MEPDHAETPPIARTPPTIALLPFFASGRFPRADSIGRCHQGGVEYTSGRELIERVRDVSLGLAAVGMSRGDRVALIAESQPDWLVADFAILAAGAVTTPIYPTLSVDETASILADSGASLAIVSTGDQLEKVAAASRRLAALRAIVVMDSREPREPRGGVPITTLSDVARQGHQRILDGWGVGRTFHDEAKNVRPDDLATIIYTSGTTGQPKGVMLTHGNLAANLADLQRVLSLSEQDVALSFLPLSHAFERMVAYVYLAMGVSLVFAEAIGTISRDFRLARPTVMTGVPRVFEKLQARILEKGREAGGVKRAVFEWAMRVADARARRLPEGRPMSWHMRVQSQVAERRVFRLVRESLGGRMRFAVSGSAPLRPDIGRFFCGLGLPILEGYGLTETAPVLTVTRLDAIRFGSVGRALPSVELRIDADGEILARGPNVMAGYYQRAPETAAVMTDGWFHTGDIGAIDAESYLRITDRKKEIIVTSGGKKIAPQPIEDALRRHALVAEAVLVGDERRFPAVLLVPDVSNLCQQIGASHPRDVAATRALLARPDVLALYQGVIDAMNASLAQFERIKKFAVLPQEFSAEDELTPTLKLKRRVIEHKYRDTIEKMYL